MLWSVGSSQFLKHCTFSRLLANFKRTNIQTKKKSLYFAHHWAVKGYKHNPFYVKSVRSESETSSHWKIVIRVMPGVEEGWVSFVTAHVGKRWPWRFTAGMEQSQREKGWELQQAVALTQVLMSSAWQHWRRLSLVFHAGISHCSLTTCFPAVTCNTALWKGARNSSLNSFSEYILKCQVLQNVTLQSVETSHQWGETSLKAEIIQVPWRYLTCHLPCLRD